MNAHIYITTHALIEQTPQTIYKINHITQNQFTIDSALFNSSDVDDSGSTNDWS